jgi:hypothetical protein
MFFDVTNSSTEPEGIGGWLLLPIAVLCATIYGFFEEFQRSTLALLGPGLWDVFVMPGTYFYHSPWVIVIVGNAVLEIAILVVSVVALVAIWRKKKAVPHIMIGFYVLALSLTSMNALLTFYFLAKISPELANQITTDVIRKEVGIVIIASVFIPYFLKSKRVKNTFTN